MKNPWLNEEERKIQEAKSKLTRDIVVSQTIAADINQWLHQKGDEVHRYGNFMDRVVDIYWVVRDATALQLEARWVKTGLLSVINDRYARSVTAVMLESQRLANEISPPKLAPERVDWKRTGF